MFTFCCYMVSLSKIIASSTGKKGKSRTMQTGTSRLPSYTGSVYTLACIGSLGPKRMKGPKFITGVFPKKFNRCLSVL